jgi:hypothetical protein
LRGGRSGPVKTAGSFALERLVWISLVATFAIFLLAYLAPFIPATIFPRALLIPFLFGSLVLILSCVQRFSHFWGVPLLAIIIGLSLLLTGLNRHFNDVRTLTPIEENLPRRQIGFSAAVERWKNANDCSAGTTCPPALVIAIDGGASRAAFSAATFIGETSIACLPRMNVRVPIQRGGFSRCSASQEQGGAASRRGDKLG